MNRSPFRVRDVMTARVVAVAPETGFKQIADTLEEWRITAVPVVDADRRVLGVVSEADLLAKEEFHDRDPGMTDPLREGDRRVRAGGTRAADLMTAPAVTVGADAPLPEAARLMARGGIKRLPVVGADGVLHGVVSRSDLLKVFLRTDDEIADEVRTDVVRRVFPVSHRGVEVSVRDGVVTLSGIVADGALIPLARRLALTVEGVVGVECVLGTSPTRAPL
ncbi:CBS domain-containing protein [Streptomyces sp. NPDC006798]|uniref:CBS domain-containing protein n=1 Tax=Streptomyces sp. NPDC006798 TaxID=3155462 RepID=UPI0033FD3F34